MHVSENSALCESMFTNTTQSLEDTVPCYTANHITNPHLLIRQEWDDAEQYVTDK